MGKIQFLLSKTKIKNNDQCRKRLWMELHRPELAVWEEIDKKIFEQGREVEALARAEFPTGIEQDKKQNAEKIIYTKELLKKHDVIYEASFLADETIVMVDILVKKEDGTYKAIEVKSGSSKKDEYIDDTTIQYYIVKKDGQIVISEYELWYVSKQATGVADLFAKESVLEDILANEERFNYLLTSAKETLAMTEMPDATIGSHCNDPNSCPFFHAKACKAGLQEESPLSVLNLPNFAQNSYKAIAKGIYTINDPRFKTEFSNYVEKNAHVIKAIETNSLVMDHVAIKETIMSWIFPLRFFDFETFGVAVPVMEGQRPYNQLVVQHSNHVLHGWGDKLIHEEFLHDSFQAPHKFAANAIISHLGDTGSIVSYNMTFEKTCIKELAKVVPENAEKLHAIADRFVDLLPVIKKYVYHPDLMGSYSLKVVSPVLLGKENGGYTDSVIKSGAQISTYYYEFLKLCQQVEIASEEQKGALIARRDEIRDSLLKYCKYDTLNLYLLLSWLLDQSVDLKKLIQENL